MYIWVHVLNYIHYNYIWVSISYVYIMYTGLWYTCFCTLYNGIFLEIGSLSHSPMNSVCTNMSWNVVIMQSFWPWLSLASGRTSPTLMPQSTLVASFPVCRNQTTKPPNPKNFLAEWRFKYLQKVKLVRLVGGIRKNSSLNRGIFLSTLFRYKISGVLKMANRSLLSSNWLQPFCIFLSYLCALSQMVPSLMPEAIAASGPSLWIIFSMTWKRQMLKGWLDGMNGADLQEPALWGNL